MKKIKMSLPLVAIATTFLLVQHLWGTAAPEQEGDRWSGLEFSLTLSCDELRRGDPVEAIVSVRNGGSRAVNVATDQGDVFYKLSVYYTAGEDGEERAFPLSSNEAVLGQPPIMLPPGGQIDREVQLSLRGRGPAEVVPGAGRYIPVTDRPGVYRLWVGSGFEYISQVSPVEKVSVLATPKGSEAAYSEYSTSHEINQLFDRPDIRNGSMGWAKSFLEKYPDAPQADLVRLQLARRALERAGVDPKLRRDVGLMVSTEGYLLSAELHLSEIDNDTFPLPLALEAVRAAIKRERLLMAERLEESKGH